MDQLTFARDYWDQKPLLTRAVDLPVLFSDLFSSAAVDELVGERALRVPFFKLVKEGGSVGAATRSAVAGSRTVSDLADPDTIARAYGEGATLVLQSLHRMHPPVAALCRDLASELGHPTQCNAYITPAGTARGFDFHHDTHDVIVLQVEGTKRWLVHPPVVELPTKAQPRSGPSLVPPGQPPLLDIVLEPGDTLYLPRGFVHAAETTSEASVHLTVGVVVTTWLDVLQDAVTALGPEEFDLRRALPIREAGHLDTHEAADLLKRTADWITSLRPEQVEALLAARLAKAESVEPARVMDRAQSLARLSPATPVRVRAGIAATVTPAGERVILSSRVTTLSLPAQATQLLRRALTRPSTPARLVDGDRDCDLNDALVVVRRLLREGILVCDE